MKYRVYRQGTGKVYGVEYLGRKEYIKTFDSESEADAYATRMDELNPETYGYEEVEEELVKYLPWKTEEDEQPEVADVEDNGDGPCDQDGILEELYCRGMISEREYLNHYDIEPENERY